MLKTTDNNSIYISMYKPQKQNCAFLTSIYSVVVWIPWSINSFSFLSITEVFCIFLVLVLYVFLVFLWHKVTWYFSWFSYLLNMHLCKILFCSPAFWKCVGVSYHELEQAMIIRNEFFSTIATKPKNISKSCIVKTGISYIFEVKNCKYIWNFWMWLEGYFILQRQERIAL